MTAVLFLGFGHGFLGRLKADLGMGAVAKWFLGRRAATTERHPFLHREFISVAIHQFHLAVHDVRTVLDCLDCYFSHVAILTELQPSCHFERSRKISYRFRNIYRCLHFGRHDRIEHGFMKLFVVLTLVFASSVFAQTPSLRFAAARRHNPPDWQITES